MSQSESKSFWNSIPRMNRIAIVFVGIVTPIFALFQNFTYVPAHDLAALTANPCSLQDASLAAFSQEGNGLPEFSTLSSAMNSVPHVSFHQASLTVSHPEAMLWVNGENSGKQAHVKTGDVVQIEMKDGDRVGRCSLGFANLAGQTVVWQLALEPNRRPAGF